MSVDDLDDLPELEASLAADVADMAALIDAHTPAEDGEEEAWLYATVDEWVGDWLAITIDRRIGDVSSSGVCWCPKWWAHPEALNRIYLLWQTWEHARIGGTMPDWWSHFDQVWTVLTADEGPFRDCRPARRVGERITDPAKHDGHDEHGIDLLSIDPVPDDVLSQLPEGAPQPDE